MAASAIPLFSRDETGASPIVVSMELTASSSVVAESI
jgi:hypothetical protein